MKKINFLGKLIRGNRTVAMKISPTQLHKERIMEEYTMYTYLKAIENSTVETYGIPAVYYYGEWKDYTLIGLTLLDPQFTEMANDSQSKKYYIDILIIFRELVMATKYMHSHGICHGDIKLDNIMFRKNRGFLFGKLI